VTSWIILCGSDFREAVKNEEVALRVAEIGDMARWMI